MSGSRSARMHDPVRAAVTDLALAQNRVRLAREAFDKAEVELRHAVVAEADALVWVEAVWPTYKAAVIADFYEEPDALEGARDVLQS